MACSRSSKHCLDSILSLPLKQQTTPTLHTLHPSHPPLPTLPAMIHPICHISIKCSLRSPSLLTSHYHKHQPLLILDPMLSSPPSSIYRHHCLPPHRSCLHLSISMVNCCVLPLYLSCHLHFSMVPPPVTATPLSLLLGPKHYTKHYTPSIAIAIDAFFPFYCLAQDISSNDNKTTTRSWLREI